MTTDAKEPEFVAVLRAMSDADLCDAFGLFLCDSEGAIGADKIVAHIATLTRERDEARRDGARLDWLESRTSFLVHQWQGGGYTLTLPQPPVDGVRPPPIGFTGDTLRAAIDVARTADAGVDA